MSIVAVQFSYMYMRMWINIEISEHSYLISVEAFLHLCAPSPRGFLARGNPPWPENKQHKWSPVGPGRDSPRSNGTSFVLLVRCMTINCTTRRPARPTLCWDRTSSIPVGVDGGGGWASQGVCGGWGSQGCCGGWGSQGFGDNQPKRPHLNPWRDCLPRTQISWDWATVVIQSS